MANEILLTPETLREQARQIRTLESQDKSIMQRMTNLVQTLTVAWNSPSQAAFVQKYMSMQPVVTNFHQSIEEFAELLIAHADRMERVDQDMAGRIGQV